jgi:hypothetical protein
MSHVGRLAYAQPIQILKPHSREPGLGFVLSSSDRIVVTAATTAKKDWATELSLADFLRENGVALTAAQIVVGFPSE